MRLLMRWLSRSLWRGRGYGSAKRAFARRPNWGPTAGQEFKALCSVGSLDDLDCPVAGRGKRVAQFIAGIAAIGEDVAPLGKPRRDVGQHQRRVVAVLNISRVNDSIAKVAAGVGQDMALPDLDLVARVAAADTTKVRGFASLGF